MRNYDEDSDKGYEVNVEYPKHLHKFHNYLHFLQEKMKIKKSHKRVCIVTYTN